MKNKNIKTFEQFTADGYTLTNEFNLINMLGGTTASQKMAKALEAHFNKYVKDATGGDYKNPVEDSTPEDYKTAYDMLKKVDMNIKKMTGDQKYIDIAKYLLKRAEASVSMTAKSGHEFGKKPQIGG